MPQPASLADMFSGKAPLEFNPRDYAGNQIGMGDAIAQNSNSLVGLGMGLLQPYRPGESPYTAALQGYQAGSVADSNRGYRTAQLQHQKAQDARQAAQFGAQQARQAREDAYRREQDTLNRDLQERQFARTGESSFAKIARDLDLKPGTPEYADQARKYVQSQMEGEWESKDIIDPGDPDGERKITVQQNKRTGQYRRPELPGTATTTVQADPFTAGVGQPVYGAGPGGFSTTPQAGAVPTAPVPTAATRGITLPSGEVVTPPPGLSKKGREAWQNHIAATAADMASGKMTEGQAKYSIYATGMEIAQRELESSSHLGTSAEGKGLGGLPWGVGAYFQSNAYQNYRNAKDAWLNAKLRAESGATINPDEFARDDRIYFPQPGEGTEQIAAKARLREQITKNMTKAGGPGYTSPPPLATAPAGTPAAPGAAPIQPTAAPVRVTSPGAARKLPSGTQIILPDGRLGTVP